MTGGPNFDELIGTEPEGAERDRLRHAHELLLLAGPPPELTPRLEKAPRVDNVHSLQQRLMSRRRPATLLLAAAVSVAAVFFGGYAVGNHGGGGTQALTHYALRGTAAAPHASATIALLPADKAGNWPMTLQATGLKPGAIYEVYLVRHGKPWGSCGSFLVNAAGRATSVPLNAPYRLERGDTWVVTRETPGSRTGTTVLRPVQA